MTKQKKAKYPRKIYIQIEDDSGNIVKPDELPEYEDGTTTVRWGKWEDAK